ncbi:MAG: AMP-binding protein [Chloroflexota bacterium]|nr:AMP-binding protein [Chloroflexota bacterium]
MSQEAGIPAHSFEERECLLNERLRKTVQHAYANAPAVKGLFESVGVAPGQIQTTKDLEKIPITQKEDLVKLQRENPPFGGFLATSLQNLNRICVSPGPIYDPIVGMDFCSSLVQALTLAGFRKGDIVINTVAYHMVPAGTGADDALIKLGAAVIPAGTGNTELQVQIMYDLKVTGYIGMPSFLMNVIKMAESQGYDFRNDFELRCALFGGEMLPPSLRRTFEDDYGINTSQFYGTAEGICAYECGQKEGMHFDDDLIVEIADPDTGKQLGPGEVGQIVLTFLHEAFSMIRLGTGDLSYYTDEPCPCGMPSPRLVRIMGRIGEATKVRGMFLHAGQIGEAVAKFPELSRFQVLINRVGVRDEMHVKVELVGEGVSEENLQNNLAEAIKSICRLKADKVELVSPGTIPENAQRMVDQRTWE